ncbi:MAG TPA: HD domain-containing phosphohydrolase [Gemmatimonadaceae bacterium]|nr:HD domain-containing phosphohydrolase [Gemmatimonadaceae bacterium]
MSDSQFIVHDLEASSHPGRYAQTTAYQVEITHVSLSEVLAAMSRALDLTEGRMEGHTVRTCIIGMRIADELDLSAFDKVALYGALLLKDSGVGGATRLDEVVAAEAPVHKSRLIDLSSLPRKTRHAFHTATLAGRDAIKDSVSSMFGRKSGRLGSLPIIQSRGERGEGMALRMGFSTATADAIRCIDEHWDGSGPDGRLEHEIPLFSRIVLIAQTVDAFVTQRGVPLAMRMTRERSGQWFDPNLVRIVRSWREEVDWWQSLMSPEATALALAAEPQQHTRFVDDKGLDEVAKAFAEIIDSKSPFTYQHSTNVAKYARAVAFELSFEKREVRVLNRAALLHDVGKLGVPSDILNKNGPLTAEERAAMQRHPLYTWEILKNVSAFAGFARTAALHHEKLDGSGYPWGVPGAELDIPARILCVADMYEALTANRPYRAGLTRDAALKIIQSEAGRLLCPLATEALTEATRHLKVALAS